MCDSSLISPETRFLALEDDVELESGERLREVVVAYRTWGQLNPEGDNAVLVCHALTGSADVDQWWPGLFGPGKTLDPARDFIMCSNVLGSCYGTTGPVSPDPERGDCYGSDFPRVTVRDMVAVQALLLDVLKVNQLALVIGGSLGGMQALEWVVSAPERVDSAVAIATTGRHSPWCIALSEAQRAAIRADAAWSDGKYLPTQSPDRGLAAARMMAMCTYRTPDVFDDRFGRELNADGDYQSESYLRHHGRKLVRRFDANAYVGLTRAMDSHDLGRGRGDYHEVLKGIRTPVLIVSITSDLLYAPEEQHELARWIPGAGLAEISSTYGHDGFLIETEDINACVDAFRFSPRPVSRRLAS